MNLNKKQVAVLWIGITVLVPAIYFAVTAASSLQQKETFLLTAPSSEEILIQRVSLIQERRMLFNKLGVFSFGLFSLTGLFVYLTNEKKS